MWNYFGLDEIFSRSNRASSTTPSTILTPAQQQQRQLDLEILRNNYTYTGTLTEEHLTVIKDLKNEEESRLSSIENKLSQIITQSGVIFSLTSLLAPIFKDSLSDLSLGIKIVIIICFIASFLSFLFSILVASKIYRIHNFVYIRQNPASVIEKPPIDKGSFLVANIKHLIVEINHNKEVNNIKANLLIYANRLLITGFVSSGLLSLVSCAFLLFGENKDSKQDNLSLDIKRQYQEIIFLRRDSENLKKKLSNINDTALKNEINKEINNLQIKIDNVNKKQSSIKKKN